MNDLCVTPVTGEDVFKVCCFSPLLLLEMRNHLCTTLLVFNSATNHSVVNKYHTHLLRHSNHKLGY